MIRTYAAMRETPFLRNIIGLVLEPFTDFRQLIVHSLADRVLVLAYILGYQDPLAKLICYLTRSFFWPSMRRAALLFVAACSMSGKFRSMHAYPGRPLHIVTEIYGGEILTIDLAGGNGTLPGMPFLLMFGEEAAVPCEIVSGRPQLEDPLTTTSFASKLIQKLESAFDFAGENLHAAQKKMKVKNDLGVIESIFKQGDRIDVKIKKLHARCAYELESPWSLPHEVVACEGIVIILPKLSYDSVVKLHADCLSNASIALRRDPLVHPNTVPLVDSQIVSFALDFDNSARLTTSSRDLISKDFTDIKERKAGKRRIKRNEKAYVVNALVLPSIDLDFRTAIGDSNAEMDTLSDVEGEEIETDAEQSAGHVYPAGKEYGGAVRQEAAIGVVGDQEAGGGQAIPTSTVQELAQSGDRPQSSARTMQRSVTRVRAPPIALVVMETGPGPPLWTAEQGKQGGPVQLGDGPASISEDSVAPRLPQHRQRHIPEPTCRTCHTCHRVATDSGGNSQRNYGGLSCDRNADCDDPSEVGHQRLARRPV